MKKNIGYQDHKGIYNNITYVKYLYDREKNQYIYIEMNDAEQIKFCI